MAVGVPKLPINTSGSIQPSKNSKDLRMNLPVAPPVQMPDIQTQTDTDAEMAAAKTTDVIADRVHTSQDISVRTGLVKGKYHIK